MLAEPLQIHSSARALSYGLTGLVRFGREWNACYDGEPTADDVYVLRSISDLGAMVCTMPGIRSRMWGAEGWYRIRKYLAFSGSILSCYAPSILGMTKADGGDWVGTLLYAEAGFRLAFCATG